MVSSKKQGKTGTGLPKHRYRPIIGSPTPSDSEVVSVKSGSSEDNSGKMSSDFTHYVLLVMRRLESQEKDTETIQRILKNTKGTNKEEHLGKIHLKSLQQTRRCW